MSVFNNLKGKISEELQPKNLSMVVLLGLLVLIAASLRLIPHAANFTPMLAIAIFAGAQFASRRWAFLFPLAVLAVSDLLLGYYEYMWAIYLCYIPLVFCGFWMRHSEVSTWLKAPAAFIVGNLLFFFTSNFAVWALTAMYPKTLSGLWMSYVMALPFLIKALAGTFVFGGLFLVVERLLARPSLVPSRTSK